MSAQKRQIDRPIEEIEAGEEFRSTLIPKADAMTPGEAPLWHGWAIMDAFLAGIDYARADAPASDLVKALEDRNDDYEEALGQIVQWAKAYPLSVFPEPDFKKAAELLKEGGITIDAVSASCMRHVVEGVGKIAESALTRHRQGEKA